MFVWLPCCTLHILLVFPLGVFLGIRSKKTLTTGDRNKFGKGIFFSHWEKYLITSNQWLNNVMTDDSSALGPSFIITNGWSSQNITFALKGCASYIFFLTHYLPAVLKYFLITHLLELCHTAIPSYKES